MHNKGYLNISFKSVDTTDEYVDIQGLASTIYKDRDGDIVSPIGIDLVNYKKNPIILFNHDWDKPIGKTLDTEITQEGLLVKIRVFKETNKEVYTAVKNGVLSTFSIGFIGKQGKYDNETDTYYFTEIELYEISIVSIPSNQDAVFEVVKALDCDKGACKLKAVKKDNPLEKELQEIKQLLLELKESNTNSNDDGNEQEELSLQEIKQLLLELKESNTNSNDDGNEQEELSLEEIKQLLLELKESNTNSNDKGNEQEELSLEDMLNNLELEDKLSLYYMLENDINQNLN